MLNITAGNISSATSNDLIQFLIEPTSEKLNKHVNYKDAIKNLIKQNLKMICIKSTGKNTTLI